ncbi:MAG: PAS domain S-box protein [Candidatus Sulfotelmatobacter sp.]
MSDMIQTADERRVAPRDVGKYLAQIAIVFAVQFAAGKLAEVLPIINSGGVGPVWPASGIALAALLLFGYQVWPGVAAGAFFLAFLSPIPYITAVVYAAGTTLAALTAVLLLRRVVNFCTSLSRLRDALGMIVFGAFGSSIVGASIGVSVLYASHVRGWSGFGSAWLIYWLGDSMGVLLVTPLVLTFPTLLRIRPRVRIAEFAALLLLLTVACFIVFGDLPLIPVRLNVLAFAVLPFVMWSAIRFGVSGATLSTLFIAIIATAETAVGSGPFAQNTPFTNAILLDVFFAVLSVSGMTLAAVIAEREQAEREREELVRKQAAMEARLRLATIVESSDDAIIGKDMDEIITDWNNGAERLYGYSAGEVIGRSISFLMPHDPCGDFPEIMAKLRQGDTIIHHETARQRKDGARIEVSLTMSPIKDTEGRILGASVIGRDITERKRAEEALRESEERFRLAAQAGKMFAYEWDAATDVILRSAEAAQILGIDQAAHITGQQILAKVHPGDRESLRAAVAELSPEKPNLQVSYRMVRPDSTVIWVERNSRAHFDEQGRMLRIIGMVADVTERKQAEERLREYEKAVEGSEEMIAVVDREYRYLIANRKFLNLRNMTREQVVGHLADEVLNKGVFEASVKEKLDECFQGRVVRYEMKYTYPELGERDVFVSYFPIEGATGIDRVACILQDITDRKRAEEALSKSEERLRLAAQAGKMYAYEWDVATDVTVRSEEYANILGLTGVTTSETHHQFSSRVHAEDRAKFNAAVANLTPENPTTKISYRSLRPDGAVIWLEKSGRAFFDAQGRMLRMIGIVADITERKRGEEALSGVSRRLIEAQEQERTRISRELHDDIGQRLALLTIALEHLQQNPPNLSEVRSRMGELGKQTSEIATDIQSLSHELHSSRLEYLGITAAMRAFCKEFAEQQKVDIDFKTHGLPTAVPPDISLCLFRVLQEALHNSAKHSGVRYFEVQLWGKSSEIHLTVSDSGSGFDREVAKAGRGLGLISMEERLKLLNGTFSIESQPKSGTTIHACVPLSSGADSMRAAG